MTSAVEGRKSEVIAVFPGQGSQAVGMGKELFDHFPLVRHAFEEASDSIRLDLRKLCFDGPASELTLTENTQPAILTASVACYRVAEAEFGFVPGAVAGHSLGEYSALTAAGALPLFEAVALVKARGRAMQAAVPAGSGKMSALLGASEEDAAALCKEAAETARAKRAESSESFAVDCTVEPANFNGPGQIVISGSADAVDAAAAIAQSKRIKSIALDVSAPFHSSLMKPARARMAELFKKRAQGEPALRFPYIPNRTARLNVEAATIFPLLEEQIDHAVLWHQSMNAAIELGYARLAEFGPGAVLQGLFKRIAKEKSATVETSGVSNIETLKAFGERFAKGTPS